MRRVFAFPLIVCCLLAFAGPFCAADSPAPVTAAEIDAAPCNPNASADARSVLRLLAGLSATDVRKAIVGQNCFHGDEITDENPRRGYSSLVAGLYEKTGQWAGLVSLDYEYMKLYSPEELSAANKVLIGHWRKGGLVTVNLSPLNPWTLDESGPARAPKTWNGPGSPNDRSRARLKELVDPARPVFAVWRKKLDRVAGALAELKAAGVVVLWRPLQEQNGNWFWWGADPDGYIAVYRDMHRYFTEAKKLDNLLWVYSPSSAVNDFRAYPGDDYVDVVAPTCYDDDLALNTRCYDALDKLGSPRKPLALGEYGPGIGGPVAGAGTLDTAKYIQRIKNDYPRIAYWVCWHQYPGEYWAIIGNRNYKALMNDPDVITVERLKRK
ncbi:MAG: hypothetical protein JXD23_04375 [Spirochaetales bacterium]|nr:hypothetical protein [Spirochaetales bacterium]